MEIKVNEGICSKYASNENTEGFCLSKDILNDIRNILNISTNKPLEIINEATRILKCPKGDLNRSEICILEKLKDKLGKKKAIIEILERFLPVGPADNDNLLSNFDIDRTLKQWEKAYPEFKRFPFAMIDFNKYDHPASDIDFVKYLKEGKKCFGFILNSDVSSGRGKHWMAIFIDLRDDDLWTVEFFNSSGNMPVYELVKWMVKTTEKLKRLNRNVKHFAVSRMRHQDSRTECGVYSLYYIYSRINKVPYKYFDENKIPDKNMYEFRKELYRPR